MSYQIRSICVLRDALDCIYIGASVREMPVAESYANCDGSPTFD